MIGIVGPRQVGKTTLAKLLEQSLGKPALFWDLERDTDRQKLKEPEYFLRQYPDHCVILDEVQQLPSLLPLLRWLVDQHRVPARFILTGSASPAIIKGNTETLAGPIAYFELTPFSLLEIDQIKSLNEHWLRGGFPAALLVPTDALSGLWRDNFIETFLQRDIQQLGYDITIPNMERLLKLVAAGSGQLLNVEELSRSLGMGANTIKKYLDLLQGSFLVRRLLPLHANLRKRLVKSPKLYLRDTGLMHCLLRIADFNQLHGSHWLGASWETYVVEAICRSGGKAFDYAFFRTQAGAEVDLVLSTRRGEHLFIEIKYSSDPRPSRGFFTAAEDLQPKQMYVIVPDGAGGDRSAGLRVGGLKWFLQEELPQWTSR